MKEKMLEQNSAFHLFFVDLTLKEYKNYQKFFEDFLEKEKEILIDTYKKYITENEFDNFEYSNFLEIHFKKSDEIVASFPYNFRASFLVQIVSFIEVTLNEICEQYHFTNNTTYSVKDLKGNSDIEKTKMFLTKSCNANFKELNPEWQFIMIAKKLRNIQIHNQGQLNKVDKDWKILNAFNKGNSYFEFIPNNDSLESRRFVLKNKNFTTKLINVTEIFFKKLLNQVNY